MAYGAFKAIASELTDINACREFFSWAIPRIVEATHQLLGQDNTVHEVRKQLRQLEKDLWKLRTTMAPKMLDLIDRVEWQSHKKSAADLLPHIKDAVYDAEDLLDEFDYYAIKLGLEQSKNLVQDHMDAAFLRFYNSIKDGGLFCKVNEIQDNLDHIYEQSKALSLHETPQRFDRSIRPETCSFSDEPQIFGREKELEQLVRKLGVRARKLGVRARKRCRTDGRETMTELPVLPIVGMGGVGKTTMAQQICNDERVKAHFDCIIWTCVSDDFDINRLTREILQHLGKQPPSDNLNILMTNLASCVESKKILLVLDDMWDDILKQGGAVWKRFCKPLENSLQGSMILVTTRSSEVANLVGTMNHYDLDGLPDDVFWEFFKLCAFGSSSSSNYPELECIGKVILPKLKRSPLAAKTLGRLLRRDLNTTHWKYILESELWQLEQDVTDILPALRLSYMYLQPHLKRCFSICAMYPKDHVFEKEVLVGIWIAQGYVRPQDASLCFDDLANRSFFQRVPRQRDKFVIHDLIHDTAQLVSKDECFVITHASDLHKIPSNVRHLSIFTNGNVGCSELTKSICNKKKLRSLVCNEYYRSPTKFAAMIDSWFRELLKIRVLSFKLPGVGLPESMGNSKHLRYLCLLGRSTSLSTLPSSIRCLHHLKTIEARQCEFESFPRGFSDVISLQKIKSRSLDYNKDHSDRLCLKWSSIGISGEDQVQVQKMEELPHSNLQHLEIKHYRGGSCPSWLRSNLLPRLRSLKFFCCSNIQSIPFFEPFCREEVSDNLHCLEELCIEYCDSFTSIRVPEASNSCSIGAFSSLVRLTIRECTALLSLDEFLTPAYLPAVKNIHIEWCQELMSLPIDRLHGFSCLEEMTIERCPKLNAQGVMRLPSSLKKLTLHACGGIETIDDYQLGSSPALEQVHISECPDLRSIGGSITALKENVRISGCPQLTEIEQEDKKIRDLMVQILPRLFGDGESNQEIQDARNGDACPVTKPHNSTWSAAESNDTLSADQITVPSRCRLVVRCLDTTINAAYGTVHPSVRGPLVHKMALAPNMARCQVDHVVDAFKVLKLPVPPKEEMTTLGDAIGSFIQWPKRDIVLDNSPATSHRACTPETMAHEPMEAKTTKSKRKEHQVKDEALNKKIKSKHLVEYPEQAYLAAKTHFPPAELHKTYKWGQLLLPHEDLIKADIATQRLHQFYMDQCNLLGPEIKSVRARFKFEHFFHDDLNGQIIVAFEDLWDLFNLKELDQSLLQIWTLYIMSEARLKQEPIGFLDPVRVTYRAIKDSRDTVYQYIVDAIMAQKDNEYIMFPYNPGNHWVLVVIVLAWNKVFYLDSYISKKSDRDWSIYEVLNDVWLKFTSCGGNLWKRPKKLTHHFNFPCKQQPVGTNLCGFYVAHHMELFMNDFIANRRNEMEWTIPTQQMTVDELSHVRAVFSFVLNTDVLNPDGLFHFQEV